jgi:hypothetical protein
LKSLVLRSCILGPYVPLRTSTKRERVANELCFISLLIYDIVQIDEPLFENRLFTTESKIIITYLYEKQNI